MPKRKKKASELGGPADMSDDAIERRWRDVAQLHRLGVAIRSARFTGKKARDRTPAEPGRAQ